MISDNQRNALEVMQHGYPNLWKAAAGTQTVDDIQSSADASVIIGAILKCVYADQGGVWQWKYWTKQSVCAQALYECKGDVDKAVEILTPSLGKIKALRFQKNQGGKRVDLSPAQQREALVTQLNQVAGDVKKALDDPSIEQDLEVDIDGDSEGDDKPKRKKAHPWIAFIRKTREFCAARKADGHELDEWGLRQAEYGARMLREGFPIEALKHSSTLHFPPEARRALGVKSYDVTTFRVEDRQDGHHAALPYVNGLISAEVPCALIGPKGTGKTHMARQIAMERFNNDPEKFALISMTSATSPSAFFGRPKIGGDGGVVESQWSRICREGGLILLDEMDAADENLLLIANSAIANRIFYNQQTAQMIELHEDTIIMAAMNTFGLGAGRDYNSRNKLDAATLDRWSMGRVEIRLDERVEDRIFYSTLNPELFAEEEAKREAEQAAKIAEEAGLSIKPKKKAAPTAA